MRAQNHNKEFVKGLSHAGLMCGYCKTRKRKNLQALLSTQSLFNLYNLYISFMKTKNPFINFNLKIRKSVLGINNIQNRVAGQGYNQPLPQNNIFKGA